MAAKKPQTASARRSDFAALIADIKGRIQAAPARVVRAVNQELVRLYWDIGRMIERRQGKAGWGAAVIPRLALRYRMGDLVQANHGSVFDTITTNTFRDTPFLIPPRPLLDAFEGAVAPMFLRALCNVEESHAPSATRDALLPRLISGQLRSRLVEGGTHGNA